MTFPQADDPPVSYRLEIPRYGREWITANVRDGWRKRARLTKAWRDVAAWRNRNFGMTFLHGAHVVMELRFCANRRRDPSNWAPTAKAVLDGLVDAMIFPDDSDRYVTGPDLRIGPAVNTKGEEALIVHIYPRAESPG